MCQVDSTVVSIRIKKADKSELEKEGVDVEAMLRDDVNRKVALIRQRKMIERMSRMIKTHVKPSPPGTATKLIRADRDAGH